MANRTTYTQARARLASLCNQVAETREPYVIERRNGENVALISEAELNALLETAHLLRSPKNAARLASALRRALGGKPAPLRSGSCGGASALTTRGARKPRGPRLAVFHPEFREDLRFWVRSDRAAALRILELVEAVLREPFDGIGKPEPLRFYLQGCWSRRITQEHRLVYRVSGERIDFLQARYHY